MDLKMEVYSPSLELLGLLETYDSLIIEEWAFKPGSFSLESILNDTTMELLKPENIIWLEGETAGIIEFVQASASESGYLLSIKGSLLTGMLSRRILWGTYALYDSTPKIMYDVVKDCAISPTKGLTTQRIIPNLVLDGEPPKDARKIRKQSTGDVLTDFLSEIGQAGGVAYGVKFNARIPQMEFWARVGVDRTINQTVVEPVLYSTELDDVLSSEYSYDSSRYRNTALVAGEGEGEDRKQVTVSVGKGILPEGYTQLEYIEGTGTQWIDTGYKPNGESEVEVDAQITNLIPYAAVFGVRDQETEGQFVLWPMADTSFRYDYGRQSTLYLNYPSWKNRSIYAVRGSKVQIGTESASYPETEDFSCNSSLFLFTLSNAGVHTIIQSMRMFYAVIRNGSKKIREYIPCQSASGVVGVYDTVEGLFYGNSGTGNFVAGSAIKSEPSGLSRYELYVDARDLQQLSLENPMTSDEYTETLTTRGQEKLSDAQLVQSFSATVRTLDPTYEYGVDFLLGDTITVTDERLGLSVSAVVEGVERSVGKNGEDMILTLGYGLPTISDRLRKAGV